MRRVVRQCVHNVKPYTPGKPIEEVQREYGLDSVIKLASNENCLGPSPKAIRAAGKMLGEVHRYPDASSFYLKRALARSLGVREANLIIGNGSDEVIALAMRAFVNEGDEVVIAKPTFLMYEIAATIANARVVLVSAKGFRYDLRAMAERVTPRTKMVFIANPDNPMGTYVTKRELEKFLKSLPKTTIAFLDEAYYEFARDIADYPCGIRYLGMPNIIVARTFSKAYGLSGLRVGYGIANEELISYMEKVREPFNVNILAQAAALAALKDAAFLRKTLAHVKREKAFFYRELARRGYRYVESATNFILIDVGVGATSAFRKLLKKGIIVRDMKAWGFTTYVRVTVGTRSENRRFLAALKEIRG